MPYPVKSIVMVTLDRHGEGWEGVREGVDGDQGWPLYLQRYAGIFGEGS